MTSEAPEPDPSEEPEVTYEPCGRLGPHEPHVWLSDRTKNCTGSGEAGRTPRPAPRT